MSEYSGWYYKFTALMVMTAAVIFLFTATIQAETLDTRKTMTARNLGMGGAFTGVANDAGALIYNPAGLVESDFMGIDISLGAQADNPVKFRDLLVAGEEFYDDIEASPEDFLADLPGSINAAGQGLAAITLGDSAVGVDLRADMIGEVDADKINARLDYTSSGNARIGLSSDIVRIPAEVGTAAYGVNLRYNRRNIGIYEVYEDEDNNSIYREWQEKAGSGLAFDGGLLLQLTPLIHMGVMVENLWAQDIELTGEKEVYEYDEFNDNWIYDEDRSEADLSRHFSPDRRGRIGVAARIPVIATTVAADLENAPLLSQTDDDPLLFIGAENEMFFDTVRLRAGTYSYENRVFTAGAGINLRAVDADLGAGYSPAGNFFNLMAQIKVGF